MAIKKRVRTQVKTIEVAIQENAAFISATVAVGMFFGNVLWDLYKRNYLDNQ